MDHVLITNTAKRHKSKLYL